MDLVGGKTWPRKTLEFLSYPFLSLVKAKLLSRKCKFLLAPG